MSEPEKKLFGIKRTGGILVITPQADLSQFLFEVIGRETSPLIDAILADETMHVIFDMHNTDYFGTDFIALLLKIWKRLRARKGRLVLCSVSDREKDVLRICELDNLWPIKNTLAEAKAVLKDG